MPFTIDRLGRHIDAGPATTDANITKIAEHRLRDTAFRLARRRFLGEIDNSPTARIAGDAA